MRRLLCCLLLSTLTLSSSCAPGLLLGIDCGTQGLKALVYDASTRRVIGRGAVAYGLDPKPEHAVGRAEQQPSVWLDAMWAASDEALAEADAAAAGDARKSVVGIGVSGQQHGLVALDAEYEVIRPSKLWCDTESASEAMELSELLGHTLVASFTATKLLWLKRHEPHHYARLAHVALPHDYLNLALTGSLVMEGGDASGTGLLDSDSREWDVTAVEAVDPDLLSKLPRLIRPTEPAGTLQEEAAKRLGLRPGLVVSAGGGDNMMSALGCGCTSIGRVAISLGTSGTIFGKSARAARDSSGAVCPFLDATGGGLPLVCTINCAAVPEEVRVAFGLERDAIATAAAEQPIGCEGVSFLPYLGGERTPNWPTASGVIAGLRAGHLAKPGLLYRAALEGVTFGLRQGLEAMRAHGLEQIDEVRLVGGGSKSALWRRIVADALQVRVASPVETESAALGAALQAAAVHAGAEDIGEWIAEHHDVELTGILEPDSDKAVAYEEAYTLYLERASRLFAH